MKTFLQLPLLLLVLILGEKANSLSRFKGNEPPHLVRFDQHFLLSVEIMTHEESLILEELYLDQNLDIDLWTDNKQGKVETLVPYSSFASFLEKGLKFEILLPDVQKTIEERKKKVYDPQNEDWFDDYHNMDEIKKWMDEQVRQHPRLASKFILGETYLGEKIEGIRIHSDSRNSSRTIVFHGGQHSNEWIGPAVVTYLIHSLLSLYGKEEGVTKLVSEVEWYIIPVLNIDGYRYTWSTNPGWRKNRQPIPNSDCLGIDCNRNWPYKFNTGGSSSEPCSNTYHGGEPFKAPEPRSVSDFITKLQSEGKEVLSYIDWHCCGLMWMNPWGYTCNDVPDDDEEQKRAGTIAVEAAKAVHGVSYKMGNICNIIYLASGSSVDHVYGNQGVKYSFALELRSSSQFNPSLILPNSQEMWAAVFAYVSAII